MSQDEQILYDPTAEPRILATGLAPRLDPVVAGEHPELAILLPVAQGQG